MIDVQSILSKSGIQFIDVPFYQSEDCITFEREYTHYLTSRNQTKSRYLMDHDIWALQFTHNEVINNSAHWAILTFDNAMIKVATEASHAGWIVTPYKFLDITSSSESLSDTQYVSLVHSLAVSSAKTLSTAARIIDRVVSYASDQLQNWEFKSDFENFKKNLMSELDSDELTGDDENSKVDSKVDEFLRAKGIDTSKEEE
ncbi:hypothetical protein AYO28_16405 [Pseudomonas putida]|uniref:Uncharacterized protein n=2 Tax=Pseudomonas putida TaxID=303 RepID=A0A177SQM0_PSEPU|nr:hypothetical protein AYO28_16405 [Pseudomonas putida]